MFNWWEQAVCKLSIIHWVRRRNKNSLLIMLICYFQHYSMWTQYPWRRIFITMTICYLKNKLIYFRLGCGRRLSKNNISTNSLNKHMRNKLRGRACLFVVKFKRKLNHPLATVEFDCQIMFEVLLIQMRFPVSNICKQNGDPVPLFCTWAVHNTLESLPGLVKYTTKFRSVCNANLHGCDVEVWFAVHMAVDVTLS